METYSHSRIQAYKQCPKKYELGYILKAPRAGKTIEAFMGSRVHEALEWLYTEVAMCRLPEAEAVVDRFQQAWDAEWDPCVRVVRSQYTADDYRALGEKCVRDFYVRHRPFDADTTIGLEQRVVIDLSPEHRCQGYIDRLVKVGDGEWEIHDYKTAKRLPSQEQADSDEQLALYELAVRKMYPDASSVTLVWHYLQHDTAVRSTRSAEQLASLRESVCASIDEIEAATEFPARIGTLCGWCDYRASCPEFAHEARIEEVDRDTLRDDSDVILVERFAELSEAMSGLKAERDNIRAELLSRMESGGLSAMVGTEHRVRVTRTPCARIPSAGETARQELEGLLKGTGLWDRFSHVSARDLSGILEDRSIPADVRRELGRYVTMEHTEALRCSKREG